MYRFFKKALTILFISIAILLIAAMLLPISKSQKSMAQSPFPNSHFIEVDNTIIHYRYWKPDSNIAKSHWVMLIHGLGGSTYAWENNAEFLSKQGLNVIAVDVPPFGYSDRNPEINHSPDVRANLLWKFASQIHPSTKWHLVGHSMGGGITEAMAIKKPERTKSLTWVAPALFIHLKKQTSFGQILLRFPPFERTFVFIGETFFITPKRISKMLLSAYGREATEKEIFEYHKALSQDGTATAFVRAFTQSKVENELKLKDLSIPALAIWGDSDQWVPYERYQTHLKEIPNIQFKFINGAGHCPMETHPQEFNQLLLENILKND
jgi:2-hydroxy-6-oxonona-2,4-dienedioate hydrolase